MPLGFGHHSQRENTGDERGRDPFIATGRGGAGNIIRSPSRSRDRGANEIPAATAAHAQAPHITHSGRGGAGNVRSPSRDPLDRKRAEEAQAREEKLQEDYRQQEKKVPHSTGRGGAGNIASTDSEAERGRGRNGAAGPEVGGVRGMLRSLSRSRSREPRANGNDSPNRSGSRVRASEGSRLAQVDETPRSSAEEDTLHDRQTYERPNGAGVAHRPAAETEQPPKPGFVERLASHLPGR
ncbi:uncharacterized protein PFL1_01082 [Pseudozyma flocculosa PF-1]|uniref:Uncharacterized protein n=1 Tax=Pseudozyma flocculosa TaxID=84751 RepID=A0A5C3FC54_9BASI|nr:uncharacterized protein PFL1_01082 [Pseudozyma flocculosa PF-1]EPQ31750.1 hypothetical protein PFL1_01082 [Pseudozyma flocculosa PF-1]SPO41860.1 uncharacterized protein PSFLO_07342 [Pseudozyma flocculosa]